MKIRTGYMLRHLMDIYVIVGIGSAVYKPYEVMSLNESGAFLWHILENGAERQTLVVALLDEYELDPQTAERDTDAFLAQLREKDLLEEC